MDACEVKNPRAKRFCEIFVRLWLQQWESGIENPRVGRQAAMIAGYGGRSWNEVRAPQAADVMFNKLVKRPEVVNYIRELGLERDGRYWRAIQTD